MPIDPNFLCWQSLHNTQHPDNMPLAHATTPFFIAWLQKNTSCHNTQKCQNPKAALTWKCPDRLSSEFFPSLRTGDIIFPLLSLSDMIIADIQQYSLNFFYSSVNSILKSPPRSSRLLPLFENGKRGRNIILVHGTSASDAFGNGLLSISRWFSH